MKFNLKEHKTSIGFLLSLCLLFTFSLVGAAATASDVFKVNELIEYNKPCVNNGTWCSAATTCNYTFYNMDNSIRLNNVAATNVGGDGASIWQYNLSHSETGLYKVDLACIDGSQMGFTTLYYEVTGAGVTDSLGFYIIIFALSFGVIILGFAMKDPPITILGSFGLYFVALYILFNGIAGTKDPTTTWAIGLITLCIAMYVSIRSSYELIVDPE